MQFDSSDIFHDIHKLVDRDHLAGTEIDGVRNIGRHDPLDAIDAVIDVHEAAGLIAVAPDIDLMLAGGFGVDHFAADRGGGLFASAVPGAVRAVDIVEAGHTGVKAEIFSKVAAHALAE